MMADPTVPPIGADVTDLMPPIGADVSDLMMEATATSAPAAAAPPSGGLGGFLSEATAGINPIKINAAIQQAFWHPIDTAKGLLSASDKIRQEGQAAFKRGDYLTGTRKMMSWLASPLLLPMRLDEAADLMQQGEIARGLGATADVGLAVAGPSLVSRAVASPRATAAADAVRRGLRMRPGGTPADVAAVEFGMREGIPVDVATATGNTFVRGIQSTAERSLGGSIIGGRARAAQAEALSATGRQLAEQVQPAAVTPEAAGQAVRDLAAAKVRAQKAIAKRSYDEIRRLEAEAGSQMEVPLPAAAVDALPELQRGALRQIVHELDAMPYTRKVLQPGEVGGSLEHVAGTGGAGAKVYHDIVAHLEGQWQPTRAQVQAALEDYLAGGNDNAIAKAAREVAKLRERGLWAPMVPSSEAYLSAQRGRVQRPEMGTLTSDVPTRGEVGRVTSETMGLPTNIAAAKAALQPLLERFERLMPEAQQAASPGLKAIRNIVNHPKDWMPLTELNDNLSAIKTLARQQGGVSKLAVRELERALQETVSQVGAPLRDPLTAGRTAVKTYAQTEKLIDKLPGKTFEENVAIYRRATAPNDGGLQFLRILRRETPAAVPQIARAYLDDLLRTATGESGFQHAAKLAADWQRLGPETKRLLFPDPAHRADLDSFFLLAKKMAENPNPSGTAHTAGQVGQAVAVVTPSMWPWAPALAVGGGGVAALLMSPRSTRILLGGLRLPSTATAARAAWAQRVGTLLEQANAELNAARRVVPATATQQPDQAPR